MIEIIIKKDSISITGHSGYEEIGKDIVCASVSSMVITTVNAIGRIDSEAITYLEKDGVFINIIKHTEIVDLLITNLLQLLEQLINQYPQYIKMRRC